MIEKQSDSHPVKKGVTMTPHHIIPVAEMAGHPKRNALIALGYVVHDSGNLVLMPNHEYGACHLETQLHKGSHDMGLGYDEALDEYLDDIERKIKSSEWCNADAEMVQKVMNSKSNSILGRINKFTVRLNEGVSKYKSGNEGCGDCLGVRNHGLSAAKGLQNNFARRGKNEKSIIFDKPKDSWVLMAGS